MASNSQTLLDAVDAAIAARLSGGAVKSLGVDNQQIEYMPLPDLLALRTKLQAEVAAGSGDTTLYPAIGGVS